MSNLINLGCKVADVHHRYDEIHCALFGAASFRLLIDALLGRRRHTYKKSSQILVGLQGELAALEVQVADPNKVVPVTGTDREAQQALLTYIRALVKAISGLEKIYTGLEHDEAAYRGTAVDDRSGFTADKLHYDHLLSDMERVGTRLNKLFSNY